MNVRRGPRWISRIRREPCRTAGALVLLLAACALLGGCHTAQEGAAQQSSRYAVRRIVDAKVGVVCWIVEDTWDRNKPQGISCLPLAAVGTRA